MAGEEDAPKGKGEIGAFTSRMVLYLVLLCSRSLVRTNASFSQNHGVWELGVASRANGSEGEHRMVVVIAMLARNAQAWRRVDPHMIAFVYVTRGLPTTKLFHLTAFLIHSTETLGCLLRSIGRLRLALASTFLVCSAALPASRYGPGAPGPHHSPDRRSLGASTLAWHGMARHAVSDLAQPSEASLA